MLRLRQQEKNVSVLTGNTVPVPKLRYNQGGNLLTFLSPVMLMLLPLDCWDGGRGSQNANMKNKPAVR